MNMTRSLGRKINTSMSTGHLRKEGAISEPELAELKKYGHHVEHRPEEDPAMAMVPRTFNKTIKTSVYVPEEKVVKVPVIRKEKEKIVEKHTIKATRLVPVTRFKEVQEINLHDRKPVPGERAKTGDPKTQVIKTSETAGRTRKIPYQDFEEQEYEITVDVPREVVKTRVGYRLDKQLRSNLVDVEEDCVFEMRPVLVRKGAVRAKETKNKEYHGKCVHGEPVWDGGLYDGWHPEYGVKTPTPSRPGTSYSTASRGSYMSRMGMDMTGSPSGLAPSMDLTAERPLTGTRSAPTLHKR